MEFARDHLKKHGWVDGGGLGKTESGIKEAIKVKLKQDKSGVGHDPGAEFTFHWWDHVFNKAANKFQVQHTQDGVEVKANGAETERSRTKEKKRKKALLYGQFVKGATLKGAELEEEEPEEKEAEPEGDTTPTVTTLITADDEEILRKCGGRTAHKGARHGLKLNGKLYRIEQQEKLRLEREASKSSSKSDTTNPCSDETTEREASKSSSKSDTTNLCSDETTERDNVTETSHCVEKQSRKKKKKKRKRDEDCRDNSTEVENVYISTDNGVRTVEVVDANEVNSIVMNENNCDLKKEKKSKKKTGKKEKGDTLEVGMENEGSMKAKKRKMSDEESFDNTVKKKSKKKKKSKA